MRSVMSGPSMRLCGLLDVPERVGLPGADFRHFSTCPGSVKRVVRAAFRRKLSPFLSRCTMWYQPNASGTVFDREATMRALTVTTALLLALATLPASAEQRT